MTDTGTIFYHEDDDGDGIRVVTSDSTSLDFKHFGPSAYCGVGTSDVRRLHSALGKWLAENGVTMDRAEDVNPFVKPAPSVGGDDRLRSVVREEILEALLLLKATADYCDIPYGTPELDSRAYRAIETVAEQAAASWKDAR